MPTCTARSKRSGRPCRNPAAAGKTVCRFHGGAPGSGGQPGNQNARVHGLYAHAVPEQYRELLAVAEELDGLHEEIKLLRVRIAVACQQGTANLDQLGRALQTLASLVRSEHAVSGRASDNLDDALAQVLKEIGSSLGIDL